MINYIMRTLGAFLAVMGVLGVAGAIMKPQENQIGVVMVFVIMMGLGAYIYRRCLTKQPNVLCARCKKEVL